jgi:hypothetical protein
MPFFGLACPPFESIEREGLSAPAILNCKARAIQMLLESAVTVADNRHRHQS